MLSNCPRPPDSPQGPGGVIRFRGANGRLTKQSNFVEPSIKRAVAFIDGQNLYHHARAAFNCTHPNYDVMALAKAICDAQGWYLKRVNFYTGVPEPTDDAYWHKFWSKKLLSITRGGSKIFSRRLRCREKTVTIDGTRHTFTVGEEKGIDVRIALDAVSATLSNDLDVAIIFSQDQDMSEVVDEIEKNLSFAKAMDQSGIYTMIGRTSSQRLYVTTDSRRDKFHADILSVAALSMRGLPTALEVGKGLHLRWQH